MGITVKEILECKYLREGEILAGKNGLHRKVQAVAIFDAPDGYKWFKGREFVVTSGFLFKDNLSLFKDVIHYLSKNGCAGMGIKVDRYLHHIPKDIITLCNQLDFILVSLPYDAAWIDIINEVNSLAMNKYILKLHSARHKAAKGKNYREPQQKIKEVIANLSTEINCEILLYDLVKAEVSAASHKKVNRLKNKDYQDLWEPSFSYQKEVICDRLNICRFVDLESKSTESWIVIPVMINQNKVAHLVIWEVNGRLDYYDLFVVRLSLTLIHYTYEEIYMMNAIEERFQDDFLSEVLSKEQRDPEAVYKKAAKLKLNLAKNYISVCLKQANENAELYKSRETIAKRIHQNFSTPGTIFGLLEENKLLILVPVNEKDIKKSHQRLLRESSETLVNTLNQDIVHSQLTAGVGIRAEEFHNIRKSYIESAKAVDVGRYVYPGREVIFYDDLGPFKLMRIESFNDENLKALSGQLAPLLEQEDHQELTATLRTYLDCKQSYSLAGKKLFIHSNTVRYRIEKIQQLCSLDLNDATERIKIELTLRFIE